MYNSHCDGIKKTIENVIIAFNTIMDFYQFLFSLIQDSIII